MRATRNRSRKVTAILVFSVTRFEGCRHPRLRKMSQTTEKNELPRRVMVHYGTIDKNVGKKIFILPPLSTESRKSDLSILREKCGKEIEANGYLREKLSFTNSTKIEDILIYQTFEGFSQVQNDLLGPFDDLEDRSENVFVIVKPHVVSETNGKSLNLNVFTVLNHSFDVIFYVNNACVALQDLSVVGSKYCSTNSSMSQHGESQISVFAIPKLLAICIVY